MKLTLKLFLVVCLFSSVSLAEGDMGSGGKADAGDMGSGGKACTEKCRTNPPTSDADDSLTATNTNQEEAENSILDFVKEYLNLLLG